MPNEYITMSDETTITINTTDTLDLDINHHYGHTIDISTITNSTIDTTIDFDELSELSITLNQPVEFEDHMPDVAKIEDMCNDYPSLAKAYENFKSIYAMVHQDWKGRQDSENEPPF